MCATLDTILFIHRWDQEEYRHYVGIILCNTLTGMQKGFLTLNDIGRERLWEMPVDGTKG